MSAFPQWAVPSTPNAKNFSASPGASPPVRRLSSASYGLAEQSPAASPGGPISFNLTSTTTKVGSSLTEFEQDAHIWVTDCDEVWLSGKICRDKKGDVSIAVDVPVDEDERTIVATAGLRGLRRNIELLGDGAL